MSEQHTRNVFVAIAAGLVVAFFATGCATPPVHTMVDSDFVGDRTVKYMLLDPGQTRAQAVADAATEEDMPATFHFSVRICDIGEDRQEANCNDSVVLREVGLNPDPESTSRVEATREVTNLFWYDADTLYVSYMQRRKADSMFDQEYIWEPRVQMCSIGQQNTLNCYGQQALNQMLTITE